MANPSSPSSSSASLSHPTESFVGGRRPRYERANRRRVVESTVVCLSAIGTEGGGANPNENREGSLARESIEGARSRSNLYGEASSVDKMSNLTLYSYWRSSCSFRVRIALNIKGLSYDYKAVNLLTGDHHSPEFKKLNPTGFVPVLVDGDVLIGDSLAIVLYLEDKYPQTPLLPLDLQKKAVCYQAATIVSSGIQPFQNLSMLKFIEEKVSPDQKLPWAQYHIKKGFAALEDVLKGHAGRYAVGDEVSLADVFLAPQIDGAIKRFSVDMDEYPLLKRLNDAYNETPAFVDAMPDNQPDAPHNLK